MNELTTNAQTEIAIPTAALELVETSVSPNTCRAYSSIWHRFAATGLEGQVSGRTPKVGTVQSLAARGTPVIEMQQTGRWAVALDAGAPCPGRVGLVGVRWRGCCIGSSRGLCRKTPTLDLRALVTTPMELSEAVGSRGEVEGIDFIKSRRRRSSVAPGF
ncbi:MAG: hypothetical protein OXM87_07240 [Truepera sp.]|nr:hypothetical protein [Truepera sp.]